MKTEIHYCRKILSERNMTLDYYLTKECVSDETGSRLGFGAKVIMTADRGGKRVTETEKVNDAFYTEDDALRFVKLISDNTVTPVTLRDVAEDYVAECAETQHGSTRLPERMQLI